MMKVTPSGDDTHRLADQTGGPLQKNTMEKILLAMDGYKQHTYAIDFACYLARLTNSRLTGVFLEGTPEGGVPGILRMEEPEVVEEMSDTALATDPVLYYVHRFREACLCRDVPAKVHRDRGVPVGDI